MIKHFIDCMICVDCGWKDLASDDEKNCWWKR